MPIVLTAALVLAASLGSGTLAPEYEPAGDAAYTLDLELDGIENGYMDSSRLLKVGKCELERDAAYTFSLMIEAAEADGIRLVGSSCYRSYATQERAYNRRCPIKTVATYANTGVSGGKVQVGTKKARVCSGPPTARAGESNHGWGRAADFVDRRGLLDCYDREFHWLKRNAHRFGWVHPGWAQCGMPSEEAWHWEYAGVTAPSVLDYVSIDPALVATAE